jgi:hypothetical protein
VSSCYGRWENFLPSRKKEVTKVSEEEKIVEERKKTNKERDNIGKIK